MAKPGDVVGEHSPTSDLRSRFLSPLVASWALCLAIIAACVLSWAYDGPLGDGSIVVAIFASVVAVLIGQVPRWMMGLAALGSVAAGVGLMGPQIGSPDAYWNGGVWVLGTLVAVAVTLLALAGSVARLTAKRTISY